MTPGITILTSLVRAVFATAAMALRQAVVAALVMVMGAAWAGASEEEDLENRVRAEFVERFTRFVDWPEGTIAERGSFHCCVVGQSPVEPFLAEVVAERKIKGRRGDLTRVGAGDAFDACHLLLVGDLGDQGLAGLLEALGDAPVLTVAHTPGAAANGVMINLGRQGDYVTFEINRRAVERAGLTMSSNLLRLADLVEGR